MAILGKCRIFYEISGVKQLAHKPLKAAARPRLSVLLGPIESRLYSDRPPAVLLVPSTLSRRNHAAKVYPFPPAIKRFKCDEKLGVRIELAQAKKPATCKLVHNMRIFKSLSQNES